MDCQFINLSYLDGGWANEFVHEGGPRLPPRMHRHDDLEANVVLAGEAEVCVDGRVHVFRAGELWWLKARQAHMMLRASADFRLWVLLWSPASVRMLLRDPGVAWLAATTEVLVEPVVLKAVHQAKLDGWRAELAELRRESADGFHLRLAGMLRELAGWTEPVKAAAGGGAAGGRVLHPAVARVLGWLDAGDRLGADRYELAKAAGISAGRLSRLFREQTGFTLVMFRNRCRLRRYTQLEREHPEWTQLARCLAAGFGSHAQFARVRRLGVTKGKAG